MGCDGRCRARQDSLILSIRPFLSRVMARQHHSTEDRTTNLHNLLLLNHICGQFVLRSLHIACIFMETVLLWCANQPRPALAVLTESEIGHYRVADTICAIHRGKVSRILRRRRQINLFGSRSSPRAVLQGCDFSSVASLGILPV